MGKCENVNNFFKGCSFPHQQQQYWSVKVIVIILLMCGVHNVKYRVPHISEEFKIQFGY